MGWCVVVSWKDATGDGRSECRSLDSEMEWVDFDSCSMASVQSSICGNPEDLRVGESACWPSFEAMVADLKKGESVRSATAAAKQHQSDAETYDVVPSDVMRD